MKVASGLVVALGLCGCPVPTSNPPPPPRPRPAPMGSTPAPTPDAAPDAPLLPPLPSDAGEAVARVSAACKAKDFSALRSVMQTTVLLAIDTKPVTADAAIKAWRADPTTLAAMAKAIDLGCELVPDKTNELVCPADAVMNTRDLEAPFLVVMHKDKRGTWLVSQALYSD